MSGKHMAPPEVIEKLIANIPYEGTLASLKKFRLVGQGWRKVVDDELLPAKIIQYQYREFADLYDLFPKLRALEPSQQREFGKAALRKAWEQQQQLVTWKQQLVNSGTQECVCEKGLLLAERISSQYFELFEPRTMYLPDGQSRFETDYATQALYLADLIHNLPKEALLLWAYLMQARRTLLNQQDAIFLELEQLDTSPHRETVLSFAIPCLRHATDMELSFLAPPPTAELHRVYRNYADDVLILAYVFYGVVVRGPSKTSEALLMAPILFLALERYRHEGGYLWPRPDIPALVPPLTGDNFDQRVSKLEVAGAHRISIERQLSTIFQDQQQASQIMDQIDLRALGRTIASTKERLNALTRQEIRAKLRQELEHFGTDQWFPLDRIENSDDE